MRRLAIALILLLGPTGAEARDIAAVQPQSLTFAVTRNGEPIGTHKVTIVDRGELRSVTSSIDFNVTKLGLTIYRYTHQSEETWRGDRLVSLQARTNDDGTHRQVRIAHQGGALKIDREERKPLIKAPGIDQMLPVETLSWSETAPASTMPTSMWNQRITTQSVLINTHYGQQSKFQVANLGPETVATSSRPVEATHYRFTGDIRVDQWFDARGRWVKARFQAKDGSTIEYTLQE